MEEKLKQRPREVIRVVLYGPESTGKTTMAKALAAHYRTLWVEEYMREYLQEKWDKEKRGSSPEDILPIALGQIRRENEQALQADQLLFCDTDLLEIKVYSEAYFNGFYPPEILKPALNNRYDLYFLMYIDIAWTPDDLRDKPNDRIGMFYRFENALKMAGKSYLVLRGDPPARFNTAVSEIDKLLKRKKVEFSEIEILQIEERGLTTAEVERQLEVFRRGNIKVDIKQAATPGKGIQVLEEEEKAQLVEIFEERKKALSLVKFVPASGAATRMFKALHHFAEHFAPEKEGLDEFLDQQEDQTLHRFFDQLEGLPFYEKALEKALEHTPDFRERSKEEQQLVLVRIMLDEEGLNLSNLPKGLVPFHRYGNRSVTPFEEHLYEATQLLAVDNRARVHFTVANHDKEKFEKEAEAVRKQVENRSGVALEISYSFQDPKTDTIAVTLENEPFLDEEGRFFFRPGGHGALIENLNDREEDLIFLKNIDNVVLEKALPLVLQQKKILAGKLLEIQEKVHGFLRELERGKPGDAKLEEIAGFTKDILFIHPPEGYGDFSSQEKTDYLVEKLNRPLRICGMVKNEGEPGGGPFLVRDQTGEISLQIIEEAQIDKENPEQLEILRSSTHFNPVDIVCGVYDFRGEKFDLARFVDQRMSFIAHKTMKGKALKALERPGLWNGGMAFWNTLFVEVPVATFNPVKTVVDLLKPGHRQD